MRALLLMLLAGCAGTPVEHVRCDIPVTRDAGMGVHVWGCAAWTIGAPNVRKQ